MTPNVLTFQFQMHPAEHLRSFRQFGQFAPGKRGARLKLAASLAALALVIAWFRWSEGSIPWGSLLLTIVFFVTLVGGVLVLNRVRAAKLGVDVRDQRRVLTDAGLEVRNVHVVQIPWSSMLRVAETTEFFLFYQTTNRGHYLPKRAIATEADLTAVRELVQRHLGSRFIDAFRAAPPN